VVRSERVVKGVVVGLARDVRGVVLVRVNVVDVVELFP
jgi:hypothetical protein